MRSRKRVSGEDIHAQAQSKLKPAYLRNRKAGRWIVLQGYNTLMYLDMILGTIGGLGGF
jgi:hypothetical protein